MDDNPNIIFILADDMGFGDAGCFNPESKIPTPSMDRLAKEGIRFTDMHSPSAVCTPTRYGIMTGRYCWRSPLKHGVLYNYEPPLIEQDRPTIASLLKENGYHTACIGKWHLGLGWSVRKGESFDFNRPLPWPGGAPSPEDEAKIDFSMPITGGPTSLGFDYFFGSSGCTTAQPPYGFIENDRMVAIPSLRKNDIEVGSRNGAMVPGWRHKDADPIFTQKAIEYIEQRAQSHDGKPFFLYLAASAPHEPAVWSTVPDFIRGSSGAGPRGDLVALFDWMVGKVLESLDHNGFSQNTLIIVTSDNGALPGHSAEIDGRPVWDTYGHKSCGDWRGYKAHIWEGGHREPFIARWPGHIRPNSVCNELGCLQDMMATFMAIIGKPLPTGVGEDSSNLLPLLLGEHPQTPVRDTLIHHSASGVFSIRSGDWKLIHETKTSGGWPPPKGEAPVSGTPGQLYNLKDDLREKNDVFEEYPQKVQELSELLEKIRDRKY